MEIKIHSQISEIDAQQWDALVHDNTPFVKHAFLKALEVNGCAGSEFGWYPCHIAVYEEAALVAALVLYQKANSHGEFVFDHAWANAYEQHQLDYYPKLLSAVPFTPASGQRLLAKDGREQELYPLLLETVKQLMSEHDFSSWHCLFSTPDQHDFLIDEGAIERHDCQFHWHNHDYQHFEDFLAALSTKKRKNIRQERKRVSQQAINLRILDGHTATEQDWAKFAEFYQMIFLEKYGTATLNEGFFKDVAHEMPSQTLLIMADTVDGDCVAGSLMYASNTKLYGRLWGCTEQIDKLHFECCYYQGIEYCIDHGLAVFEPGAQGEHKIARGFLPTLTRSAHWLNHSPFDQAIRDYCEHEKQAVAAYMEQLSSPYKE